MPDAGERPGDEDRRQAGGEDEARRIAADAVDDVAGRGDIAAHHPERLAQRAFDQGDAMGDAVTLRNAAAAGTVHADGVDLVEIGQRFIAVGEVADRRDRGDVAVHRIDALESDQLGRLGRRFGQQLLEMFEVIVPEDALLAARIADARDHRGVIELVRKNDAARQQLAQGRQRCLVRYEARGEQKRRLLAMQARKLALQLDMVMGIAADIAGAAGAGADLVQRFLHGGDHGRVLAHAQIVVRAPDGDRLRAIVAGKALGVGILALGAQDIDEHAVAALDMKAVDRGSEDAVVIHGCSGRSSLARAFTAGPARKPMRMTRN